MARDSFAGFGFHSIAGYRRQRVFWGNSAACFDFVGMPGLNLQELTNRAPSRLPLRLGMSQKKPTRKKPTIKSPDLPPKKDAKGGRAIHSYRPSLSIPPPGFISPSRQPDGHR